MSRGLVVALWATVICVASFAPAMAQGRGGGAGGRGGRPPNAPEPTPTNEPHKLVVIGCLTETAAAGGAKTVTIKDYRDDAGAKFQLDPNDAKVSPWTNSDVEIHGTAMPDPAVTAEAAAKGATVKLTVDELFVISRGCKLKN